ncbi:hypothetical protein SAMN02745866_00477 [Alteromonadaceae bacterium Bs31]|nr:hypothetical protein SAMN02745866_00477 [Alteromonadaceae bacterium Bs31]
MPNLNKMRANNSITVRHYINHVYRGQVMAVQELDTVLSYASLEHGALSQPGVPFGLEDVVKDDSS